jgi:AraC-like DNA-binding protein
MADPLAEVVSLLQPSAPFSKLVIASASWAVRREETGRPFYFAVLEGGCHLTIDGPSQSNTITLHQGDFVLIPATRGFATSSLDRQPPLEVEIVTTSLVPMPGGVRIGDPGSPVEVRMLVGHCEFGSPDAALLVSLLPEWLHVRGEPRLSALMQLVGEESRTDRPAREIVMARLLEVLLIEALRSTSSTAASPGLMRGLADARLSLALRRMHEQPAYPWNVAQLASEAAMSRSSFFERFGKTVGMAPMEYLLAWRMALAKQLLRKGELATVEIAERVGYGSVSTFGVAFTRHVGVAPGRYATTSRINEGLA